MNLSPEQPLAPPPHFYAEGALWAHGGPAELEGGRLSRYAQKGADAGGIFLTRATPYQLRYAAAYAKGALYQVRCSLPREAVFDLSNPEHLERVAPIESDECSGSDFLQSALPSQRMGALDWATIDEEVLRAAGFRGAILAERPAGLVGPEAIFSLAVFDPRDVEIVGQYTREEVAELQRATQAYAAAVQAAEARAESLARAHRSRAEVAGQPRGPAVR